MSRPWNRGPQAVLLALEADAASARGGFACRFSTADEYEAALIRQRRAQGHYATRRGRWPAVAVIGCALTALLAALVIG